MCMWVPVLNVCTRVRLTHERAFLKGAGVSICKIAGAKKVAYGTTLALLLRMTTTYYISLIS